MKFAPSLSPVEDPRRWEGAAKAEISQFSFISHTEFSYLYVDHNLYGVYQQSGEVTSGGSVFNAATPHRFQA